MDATSSADPQTLFAYADVGLRIDAELDASAARLADALSEFAATCREYPLGIDAGLADPLRALARRSVEHDLWVRSVAEQFVLADTSVVMGPAIGEVNADGSAVTPADGLAGLLAFVLGALPPERSVQVSALLDAGSVDGALALARGLLTAADEARAGAGDGTVHGIMQPAGSSWADSASGLGDTVHSGLSSAGDEIVAGASAVGSTLQSGVQAVGNFLTQPQPWMQTVVAAQTKQIQADMGISPDEPGQQQLNPTEQYAESRAIATGLTQTLIPEDLVARGATVGAGSLVRSAEVLANAVAPDSGAVAAAENGASTLAGDAIAQADARVQELAQAEAQRLRAEAALAEAAVTSDLQDIAAQHGGALAPLDNTLKSEASLTRKIADTAARSADVATNAVQAVRTQADDINDALRYTVQADSETYTQTYQRVKQDLADRGYQLVKDKNTWAEPGSLDAGPYRGINTTWQTPDGQLFEVQFHTAESFAAKTEMHAMYEEARAAGTSPARAAELISIMTQRSDLIPVPPAAIGGR